MRRFLLLALLLPLAAGAQSDPAADLLRDARLADLAPRLLDPNWFGDDAPPGNTAFFASAHEAFLSRAHQAVQGNLPSELVPLANAMAHPDVARVDSAAWSVMSPDGWSGELADVALFGSPASDLRLADSMRVARYLDASGFLHRLALLKWVELTHPRSPLADMMTGLQEQYTYEELIDQQIELLAYQFSTPVRYALRDIDPNAVECASEAYQSNAGQIVLNASTEGTLALGQYLSALLDWTAGLAELDYDDPLPPLAIPHMD